MPRRFLLALLLVSGLALAQPQNEPFDPKSHATMIALFEKAVADDLAHGLSEDDETLKSDREYLDWLKQSKDWPHTISEAVERIRATNSPEDLAKLSEMSDSDLVKLNDSFGMGIRNGFGLWNGNTWLMSQLCETECSPEEASLKLICIAQDKLRSQH